MGAKVKNWKRRFFTLLPDRLNYQESPKVSPIMFFRNMPAYLLKFVLFLVLVHTYM
jgi:hypothetical protein